MDEGPWTLFYGPPSRRALLGVISDDFEHDVSLIVNGDFCDLEQKERYCKWLLTKLNSQQP